VNIIKDYVFDRSCGVISNDFVKFVRSLKRDDGVFEGLWLRVSKWWR